MAVARKHMIQMSLIDDFSVNITSINDICKILVFYCNCICI